MYHQKTVLGIFITLLKTGEHLYRPIYVYYMAGKKRSGLAKHRRAYAYSIYSSPTTSLTPATTPLPPTSLSSVGGNTEAYILFTQSGTITN